MGGTNSMEVAGKVEIDIFHRYYLCIATTCGTTFHTEAGSKARLAQTHQRFFTDPIKAIGQAY